MGDAGLLNLILYLPALGALLLVPVDDRNERAIRGISLWVMIAQVVLRSPSLSAFIDRLSSCA